MQGHHVFDEQGGARKTQTREADVTPLRRKEQKAVKQTCFQE